MRKASKLALVVAVVAAISQVSCSALKGESQPSATSSAIALLAQQMLSNQTASNSGTLSSLLSNPLVKSVTSSLTGVSGTEAATGTAALLTLAMNSLGSSQTSELSNVVPQLSQFTDLIPSSLSSQLTTLSSVKSVFSGLGLDASASDQMAPVLVDSISDSGASNGLINALSSLWKAS